MRNIASRLAPALLAFASASYSQPGPQEMNRHQAPAQHQSAAGAAHCCCEMMMRKMMTEMMQKHQSMGTSKPAQRAGSDETAKANPEHKH